MAHAPVIQALDNDPHTPLDQFQRDAWLRLQSSLARTLDDLYVVCEGDTQSELIKSTLRILEETVDDFRLLAGSTSPADSTPIHSTAHSADVSCSCSEQDAVHTADAAAHVSRSSCGTSCCSTSWHEDAASSCLHAGGWGKQQGSSRLSRSSSAGCNLQGLGSWGAAAQACSGSSSCKHHAGAEGGQAADGPCFSMMSEAEQGDSLTSASTASGALHHKLSSPDRLRRSPSQTKAASEQRHARAERLREQLAEARLARLQEHMAKQQRRGASKGVEPTSSFPSPVAARTADKHQRSSLLRAAHLRRIRAKAEDESRKVDEVSFINSLTNAGKKADLQQRLEEGEARRAEALAAILARQQEAAANVREAAERRRLAEAERLAQLEHRQRRKEEVQAKLEEERRAAVAAREAARAHAKAVAQQREAERQQQATQLRDRVNARLKQAAERRLQHLELIRERAALGKDFERRDSFAGGPGSGRQSPASFDRPAARTARQARTPAPAGAAAGPGTPAAEDEPHSTGRQAGACRLNIQAAAFCPAGGNSISAESSQASVSQASTAGSGANPSTAGLLPCDVFNQLQGNSQSIAAAGLIAAPSSHKQSMKGARRRMAKAKCKMQQPGCWQEPEQAEALSQSAEAQQLLAAWAPHLAVLQLQPVPHAGAAPSAPAAADAADSPSAAAPSSSADAAPAEQQLYACDVSSKSSSATNSPRSSMSSYTGASAVSTSTFSSTLVGSPAGCCPAYWMLSRSSSCCDCDSQHSASGGAGCSRSRPAAEEQQREALVALVASARSHLSKQQLLVGHLARRTGLLHRLCEEVLATCSSASSSGPPQKAKARQERLQQARLLELLGRLLELPANLDFLLSCGQLLPAFVRATRVALDHCNSLEADEPSMMTGGAAASRLSMLLQVLVAVLEHRPSSPGLVEVQEQLVGFTVAAGLVARLASVFSLFDQPMQQAARPVPPHVLQCLRLLGGLTAVRSPPDELLPGRVWPRVAPNAVAVMLEMQATSMAGVLSLLTAVLLNASPTCTPAEAASRALPPNFVEAAHLVMAVLVNVCRLDLMAGQFMLACAHHRMEFYHLISFLLSYCLSRWPSPVSPRAAAGAAAHVAPAQPAAEPAAATCPAALQQLRQPPPAQLSMGACAGCTDPPGTSSSNSSQPGSACSNAAASPAKAETGRPPGAGAVLHHPIAQLLNQVLVLIGYFCVQHPSNQAMLTWGRSPSILQRLCSLPQEYLELAELRAVLMPTLLCVCYGADRTCESVAQHFDLGQLLQYVQQQQQQQQVVVAQVQGQGLPQPAGTRKERRRQRRAQQRQCGDVAEQQQSGHDAVEQEQQLPPQAQQVLQEVRSCCSSAGQSCGPGSDGSSSAGGGSAGVAGGGSNSCDAARSRHSGGSRHAMPALGQHFPLLLLPRAAEQLQHLLSLQEPSSRSSGSNSNSADVAQQQEQLAAGAAAASSTPSQDDLQEHDQQPAPQHHLQQQQTASAASGPEAAGTEAVSLQLQIQRAPAAKLVHCEVVACS